MICQGQVKVDLYRAELVTALTAVYNRCVLHVCTDTILAKR